MLLKGGYIRMKREGHVGNYTMAVILHMSNRLINYETCNNVINFLHNEIYYSETNIDNRQDTNY
jgi:hypothetical protein